MQPQISWQQQTDATKLRTYNCTTITQLGRCKVEFENNNKHKNCIFFVVPRDGEALLDMPDIELLNILNINCNTIGTEKEEKGTNCNMSKASDHSAGGEQCCANTDLERVCANMNSSTGYYTNREIQTIP